MKNGLQSWVKVMTLRRYKKNHLNASQAFDREMPDPATPLQFWTQNRDRNRFVDLSEFANGLSDISNQGRKRSGYTGRRELILQLAPAIKIAAFGYTYHSVNTMRASLRAWFRVFDAVEASLDDGLKASARLDDVRQLTRVYCEYAYSSGMRADAFTWFVNIVNGVLQAYAEPKLYWNSPKDPQPKRFLPPEEQCVALRIALKQEWEEVSRRWRRMDRLREVDYTPTNEEEELQQRSWQYFKERQNACSIELPTSDQLRGKYTQQSFWGGTGLSLIAMREIVFPTLWDVDAAFHMCLANTGWNPAVLLDVNALNIDAVLYIHPMDSKRFMLVGKKARADGKDQPVTGLWKTPWGPGAIIRLMLKRTQELRKQLLAKLLQENQLLASLREDGSNYDDIRRQYEYVQYLEAGCRNVWLYVSRSGEIRWLSVENYAHYRNGKPFPFLFILIDELNKRRLDIGLAPINKVTSTDFRDIFALYVWRQSGGNILAVMRLLNHSKASTSEKYVDNNILNAERDSEARIFLDNLFCELKKGRVDITILAHLQRYGVVTPLLENKLKNYRAMERSRIGIACINPFQPQGVNSSVSNKRCASHRCLICDGNAIILPESLEGIAMRVEELLKTKELVPLEAWLVSDFDVELKNCVTALLLFDPGDVINARDRWRRAISLGEHIVPGLTIKIKDIS